MYLPTVRASGICEGSAANNQRRAARRHVLHVIESQIPVSMITFLQSVISAELSSPRYGISGRAGRIAIGKLNATGMIVVTAVAKCRIHAVQPNRRIARKLL